MSALVAGGGDPGRKLAAAAPAGVTAPGYNSYSFFCAEDFASPLPDFISMLFTVIV